MEWEESRWCQQEKDLDEKLIESLIFNSGLYQGNFWISYLEMIELSTNSQKETKILERVLKNKIWSTQCWEKIDLIDRRSSKLINPTLEIIAKRKSDQFRLYLKGKKPR